MWDFFAALFQKTGVLGLAIVGEALAIIFLARMYKQKDTKAERLQSDLLEMSERRLEDVVEDREKYQELSQDMNKSINLLIQVFRKKNGLNGD